MAGSTSKFKLNGQVYGAELHWLPLDGGASVELNDPNFVVELTATADGANGPNNIGPTVGTSITFPSLPSQPSTPLPSLPKSPADACKTLGHEISDESGAVYLDERISGVCAVCGDLIFVRRIPGGLPTLKIRHLISQVLGAEAPTVEARIELLNEIDKLETALAREADATREAESALRLARMSLQ